MIFSVSVDVQDDPTVLGLTEKAGGDPEGTVLGSLSRRWGAVLSLCESVQVGEGRGGGRQLAEEELLFAQFNAKGFLWGLVNGVGHFQAPFRVS